MNAEQLVRDLGHPRYGPVAQALLIRCGREAVPALRACLLGPPGPEPEARRVAAQTLGAIDGEEAFAALVAALGHNVRGLGGQEWLAEQAVRDAVAAELLRLADRRAVEPLLKCLRETHLPAAAKALAAFREVRALTAMIAALEDSFVSERIAEAIRAFGGDAVPDLLDTLEQRRPRGRPEARWSADRRALAARLLGEIGDPMASLGLTPLLGDPDPAVRLEAALALLRMGHEPAFERAFPIAIAALDGDGFQQMRCGEALGRTMPWSIPPMVEALAAGRTVLDGDPTPLGPRALVALIDLLARLGPDGTREAFAKAGDHPDPLVRRKAAWAMQQVRGDVASPRIAHGA